MLHQKFVGMKKSSNCFSGKVVIITGASSGIGRACAIEYARKGATVVLASRNLSELQKVEKRITSYSGSALVVQVDVRNENECRELIKRTIEQYGRIDILINNAGISMRADFNELDLKVIKEVMDTNFYGAVYCTKFALSYLLAQKGMVIGISSISGLTPLPGRTGYCASKYALNGFMNALRIENMRKDLRVMVVHPGFTSSGIRERALNKDGESQKETPRNESKMMTAEEVARKIARATLSGKRELVLTVQGKILVWLYRLFPRLTDKLLLHEMSREPNSPTF